MITAIISTIATFAVKAIAIAKPIILKCMVLLKDPKTLDTVVKVVDSVCKVNSLMPKGEDIESTGDRVLKAGKSVKYEDCASFQEYEKKINDFDISNSTEEFTAVEKKIAGTAYMIQGLNDVYDTDIVPLLEIAMGSSESFSGEYIDKLLKELENRKISTSKFRDYFRKDMNLSDKKNISNAIYKVEDEVNNHNIGEAINIIDKIMKEEK